MAKRAATTSTKDTRTKRVSLTGNLMARSPLEAKDQRYINCFQESLKNEVAGTTRSYLVRRPGLTTTQTVTAGEGRAVSQFYGNIYSVVGDKLYKGTSVIQTLSTTTGPAAFLPFDNAGIQYLFFCDGTDGYRIEQDGTIQKVNITYSAWQASTNYSVGDIRIPTTDNGFYYEVTADSGSSSGTEPTWPTTILSTVVDGGITWTCAGSYNGFPSPHVPSPLFIDGYMLLPRENSQDVYNCDVDNIFGWGAANFVTAEIFPDNVVALARQNNQVIAFGQESSEFIYNAGLTSGSPMARNEAAVLQMGCAAPYAIYQNEKFCLFVGSSASGGHAVWMVDGFNPKRISVEAVERALDAEGAPLADVRGYGLRTKGHLLFVIRLSDTAYVYDVEEKVWHEWQYNGNTFVGIAQTDNGLSQSYLLDATNGKVYTLDPAEGTDAGTPISMECVTSKSDFETMNRKFMWNFNIVSDLVSGEEIEVRWTDDDYNTWSNWKTLTTYPRSFFTRLGSFRRRAFHIRYSGEPDLRLEAYECEITQGTH